MAHGVRWAPTTAERTVISGLALADVVVETEDRHISCAVTRADPWKQLGRVTGGAELPMYRVNQRDRGPAHPHDFSRGCAAARAGQNRFQTFPGVPF